MKNWKIGARIVAGFSVVILIAMALGLFAYNRADNTQRSESTLADNALPSVAILGRINTRTQTNVGLLVKYINAKSPQEKRALEQQIQELTNENSKDLKAYDDLPSDSQESALYEKVKSTRTIYRKLLEDVQTLSSKGTPAENAQATALLNAQLRPAALQYALTMQDVVDYNVKNCYVGLHEIQGSVRSSKSGALVGTLLAIAFAVPIALFIVRSITQPLAIAVKVLQEVGNCNLAVSLDVDSKDEIGQMAKALNGALAQLRNTLKEVTASAGAARTSSQELAAAAEAIASGSQEQAASLEETSSSLEEITATVRQSADNARQANQLAVSSRDSAEKGQEVVATAVTAMTEINSASSKISDIISTIDEIAFQTNLLAVNAAVEAARAGDEGRGFAVVATEVRSLAQRSAGAAKEIKVLIQDSLRKVERGSELVNCSGETLQGIMHSVKRVTDIVGEISAAADEQSTGIDQVNTAVTQIDQVTQSNSAQTEELSSTAQSLAQQSARLLKLVGIFTLEKEKGKGSGIIAFDEEPAVAPRPLKRKMSSVKLGYKPVGNGLLGVAPVMLATAGGNTSDSFEEF